MQATMRAVVTKDRLTLAFTINKIHVNACLSTLQIVYSFYSLAFSAQSSSLRFRSSRLIRVFNFPRKFGCESNYLFTLRDGERSICQACTKSSRLLQRPSARKLSRRFASTQENPGPRMPMYLHNCAYKFQTSSEKDLSRACATAASAKSADERIVPNELFMRMRVLLKAVVIPRRFRFALLL